jgi:hypothetical protein
MGDRTIGAISGANVAEDHERGSTVLPALADIGAVGLLANGVEVQLAHHLLEAEIIRSTGGFDLEPRRFPLWEGVGAVSTHYLIESLWHFMIDRRVPSSLRNLH